MLLLIWLPADVTSRTSAATPTEAKLWWVRLHVHHLMTQPDSRQYITEPLGFFMILIAPVMCVRLIGQHQR